MQNFIEGIENFLWTVYRFFLSLIPSIFFILFSYIFIKFYLLEIPGDKIPKVFKSFAVKLSSFSFQTMGKAAWFCFAIVSIILTLIIESIGEAVFCLKSLLNNKILKKNKTFVKLKEMLSQKIHIEMDPETMIALTVPREMEDHKSFRNYIWYMYSYYQMLLNLAVSLLLMTLVFVPLYGVAEFTPKERFTAFLIFGYALHLFLLTASVTFMRYLLRERCMGKDNNRKCEANGKKDKENNKDDSGFRSTAPLNSREVCIIILSLILGFSGLNFSGKNSFGIFLFHFGIISLMFPLIYFVLINALHYLKYTYDVTIEAYLSFKFKSSL